ncbi:MAG: glycosyltransferase [Pseudomonadales bacterium]|nr:glycosyltransferase [Candidatus Woesebacteria bacterium]MCB9801486.1 glycosyltransferase [Pseudomonadales bacterium]
MKKEKKNPSRDLSSLKVALAHDYLREYGGAERVLEALHRLFPDAPVYTAFVDEDALGASWQKFADWDIRQSWITRIPGYKKLFSPLRLFSPSYFSSFDLSEYDVVISSTNAYFSKAVRVPHGVHLCYCHTPSRSLYGYTTAGNWKKNPVVRFFGELINHYLRIKDFEIAQQVDVFIANSDETKRRIKKFYRRNSVVIYPPVKTPNKKNHKKSKKNDTPYYLYVNRLALAKHPELAVAVANTLKLPLKVVGTGPMMPELQALAGPTIELLGFVDDKQLARLYAGATALLYPVEDEDFGMVPVEAMMHGVSVIAHNSGGPKETVIDGITGVLFDELTETGLIAAIVRFQETSFSAGDIQQHGQVYSAAEFEKKMRMQISLRQPADRNDGLGVACAVAFLDKLANQT